KREKEKIIQRMVRRVSMNEAKPGIETVNESALPDAPAQQLARAAKSASLAVNRDWDGGTPRSDPASGQGHGRPVPRGDSDRHGEVPGSCLGRDHAGGWPVARSRNTSACAGTMVATEG